MARGLNREHVEHTIVMMQEETSQLATRFGSLKTQFADAGSEVRSLHEAHPEAGQSMHPLKRLAYSAASLRRNVSALARMVREDNIDVIDAHAGAAAFVGVLAGARTKTPVVVTQFHVGKPAPVVFWPVVERINANLATRVVTDSRVRAHDLQKLIFNGRKEVDVIPNGIDPPQSAFTREEARALFAFAPDDMVITQVGRLLPFKGQWVLVEAARRILDEFPRARFLLVGFARESERGYKIALEDRAKALGISDRVTIRAYEGPIGDVWQATDLHTHPSLFESLPNAIIEGMSLRKPTVVSSAGGMPEVVLHEQTGLVVPPSDPQALADGLLRYLRHPDFATRMGEAAFRRYSEGYRAEIVAQRLENLFLECAELSQAGVSGSAKIVR